MLIRDDDEDLLEYRRAIRVVIGAIVVGLVALFVFAAQAGTPIGYVSVVGGGLAVVGGGFALGAVAGFLFGIPRRLQEPTPTIGTDGAGRANIPYVGNSSLEQISDWLTKIIVGVGLTQLTNVPGALGALGAVVGPALGGFTGSETFGVFAFLFFVVGGFFMTYLWTRLPFIHLLVVAERQARLAAKREAQLEQLEATQLQQQLVQRGVIAPPTVTGDVATPPPAPGEPPTAEPPAVPPAAAQPPLGAGAPASPARRPRLSAVGGNRNAEPNSAPAEAPAPPAERLEVIWVDDRPLNNDRERRQLEARGLGVTIWETSDQAIADLRANPTKYAAVITDLKRKGDRDAGYKFIEQARAISPDEQFIVYTASSNPSIDVTARQRGAFGATNSPVQLLDMVSRAITKRKATQR